MTRIFHSLAFSAALLAGSAGAANVANPGFVGKYVTTPQDTAAIHQVIADFQSALKTKNMVLMSSLLMSSDILFANPARPESIVKARTKIDVNFNGLVGKGFPGFADMIMRDKAVMEERFYNIRITQDDNVAVVMFDFDFLYDGKIENHGLEVWQMMKDVQGKWKIASVFWSSKGVPK